MRRTHQVIVSDVGNYPNDGVPGIPRQIVGAAVDLISPPEPVTDRILSRPRHSRKRLADHHDERTMPIVARREAPTPLDSNAQDAEVIVEHIVVIGLLPRVVLTRAGVECD